MRRSFRLALLRALLAVSVAGCGCGAQEPDAEGGAHALEQQTSEVPAPKIARVTMTGAGCPAQDGIEISGDRATFGVAFEAFRLQLSEAVQRTEAACVVSVEIEGPAGVAYAPAGMDALVTGTSPRDEPAAAALSTSTHWLGSPAKSPVTRHQLVARGRSVRRVFEEENLWSACGGRRELQLHTNLSLSGRRGSASLRELVNMTFRATKCRDTQAEPDASVAQPDGGIEPAPTATVADVELVGGCASPNIAAVITGEGRRTFEVAFADFSLANGELTKDCTVWFDLVPPPGFKATIQSYVLDGAADIPADSRAVFRSSYNPSGIPDAVATTSVRLAGPQQGAFATVVDFAQSGLVFPACRTQRMSLSFSPALVPSKTGAARLELKRLRSLKFALLPCP